ncbi:insecticidal delta-endotoxin Cry8Ea1 family protein [Bacillus cereus]|nr:insecticidal delta-endotoxin Cry8Ea1 family protein [Bacillus cereus]
MAAENVFEVLSDGTVKILNENLFKDKKIRKAITSLGGDALKQLYKDVHSGNFSKTATTLLIGAAALIPYGGAFISPILGLIFADDAPDPKITKLQEQIDTLNNALTKLDKKLTNTIIEHISESYKALQTLIKQFEHALNGGPQYFDAISDNNAVALSINQNFEQLKNQCRNKELRIELLPTYTIVATAHLIFLQFIEKNKNHPRLKIDSHTFRSYFQSTIDKAYNEYTKYIHDTYEYSKPKFKEVMGGQDCSDMQNRIRIDEGIRFALDYTIHLAQDSRDRAILISLSHINELIERIKKNKELLELTVDYFNNTWGNTAFLQVIKDHHKPVQFTLEPGTTWTYEDVNGNKVTGPKWVYYDINGNMKENEWFLNGDGKWYFFYNGGAMLKGLVPLQDKTYYFSPETLTQDELPAGERSLDNVDGYKEGEMRTGWVALKNSYYYFSPITSETPKYTKGEMYQNTEEDIVTLLGKEYNFLNVDRHKYSFGPTGALKGSAEAIGTVEIKKN